MSINSTTKETPFQVMFGRAMRTPINCALLPKASLGQSVKEYLSELQNALKLSKENTTKAKQKQKHYYDKKSVEPRFTVGQKVLLEVFKTDVGQSRKLTNKFEGPYATVRQGPNFT